MRFKASILFIVFFPILLINSIASAQESYDPGTQLVLEGNKACEEGNYQEAVAAYEKAFVGYNSIDAVFNLGVTYEINIQDRKRALFYYEKFLQLKPFDTDTPHVRQWIKEIKLYLDKEKIYDLSTNNPQSAKTSRMINDLSQETLDTMMQLLKQGNIAAVSGDYAKAVEYYSKVLEVYDSSDAYFNLGTIYAKKLSQPEKAVFYFQKFLELEPNSPQAEEIKQWIKKMEPAKGETKK
ncbi:MAG: tetratricopeptide repeat protein [Candidatus Schekmanbacteria bacterium]|nr:tetratricopeptide repeat protein [Candidatus Schekmanbacteria bacterium]